VLSVGDMQAVAAALNTGRNDQAYDLIWKLAGRVRASNPKALHGIAESRDAFDRAWQGICAHVRSATMQLCVERRRCRGWSEVWLAGWSIRST
jgi:hypothetical protein